MTNLQKRLFEVLRHPYSDEAFWDDESALQLVGSVEQMFREAGWTEPDTALTDLQPSGNDSDTESANAPKPKNQDKS